MGLASRSRAYRREVTQWLGFGIESGATTVRLQEARVAGLKEAAGVQEPLALGLADSDAAHVS